MESWPQLCTTWTLVVMGPGSRFACPGRRRVCCPIKQFQTRVRDPAARCARAVHLSLAPFEGVGNAGCPLHPRPRVHFVLVERTRVTTSTPESPGIPARNGFTTYFALLCPQNLAECANGRFSPTARRWI